MRPTMNTAPKNTAIPPKNRLRINPSTTSSNLFLSAKSKSWSGSNIFILLLTPPPPWPVHQFDTRQAEKSDYHLLVETTVGVTLPKDEGHDLVPIRTTSSGDGWDCSSADCCSRGHLGVLV